MLFNRKLLNSMRKEIVTLNKEVDDIEMKGNQEIPEYALKMIKLSIAQSLKRIIDGSES